jgi:hypothetical protein
MRVTFARIVNPDPTDVSDAGCATATAVPNPATASKTNRSFRTTQQVTPWYVGGVARWAFIEPAWIAS